MRKLTLRDCQRIAQERGGKCLSTLYVNNRTPMQWQCKEGHTWWNGFAHVKQGQWCQQCIGRIKYTLEDCQKFAEDKNGKCLSIAYINTNTKMRWQCNCGYQWHAVFRGIKDNQWCPQCAGNQKYSIRDCQIVAAKKKGKCISTEYIDMHTKMQWQCICTQYFEATFSKVTHSNQWCPRCSKGMTENKVRKIFEDIFNKPFPSVRPDFLKNPETGRNLELDGYCEELKLAFEYDGEQHYKVIWGNEEVLEKTQKNDILKDQLCEKAGVILIRIPYTEKSHLEEYIGHRCGII